MSVHIEGVGNLGARPEKKMVQVDGEEKPLVTLRVYFDRRRPDGRGGYIDQEGLWRDVTVWKAGLGDRIMKHLGKGARVLVRGTEIANSYENAEGVRVESCSIVADYVAADLVGIEQISFSERRRRSADDAADTDDGQERDQEAAD